MAAPEPDRIGALLTRQAEDEDEALDELVALLYDELRQIAHRHLQRQAPGHTIRTTALVHEAYLKLAGSEAGGWRDRAHFMATAARVMRHVLVDYARRRRAEKRGGTRVRIPLEEAEVAAAPTSDLDLMGAGRRAHQAHGARRPPGTSRGVPLLRGDDHAGSRRGAAALPQDRRAPLDPGAGVPVPRARDPELGLSRARGG